MVEINNQRKAFLDMLAWSEELITDVRNQKSWLWRHCRRRAIEQIGPITSQLSRQTKTQINRPDATSFFPVGGMPTASSLAWKTSLRKVRTLWHCSRLRSVALYLWLIVVISRQAIDRCSNIWASLPGAWLWSSEHKGWQPDCKIQQRAERSERLMYEQSHRDYLRSGYLHHRLPVMGC